MPPTWESRFRQIAAGVIESAASVRATSQQLWAELRPRLEEAGLPIGFQGARMVGSMWSQAVARRTGYQAFSKAGPEQVFTPQMAAPDINVRPLQVRNAQPEYLVRFDLTFTDPAGQQVTRTVSMRDVWRPGMTVGDVYDAVAESAEGLGNDYGQGVISFGNLRPVII